MRRRWLWAALFLLLAWGGLHLVNLARLDLAPFAAGVAEIEKRLADGLPRARPEYEDYVLATLPPNPRNGPVWRLDRLVAQARVLEDTRPPAAETPLYAMEFDAMDLAPVGLEARLEDGRLLLTATEGGFLAADGLALPKDDIGQIAIRLRAEGGRSFRLAWRGEGPEPEGRARWRHRFDLNFRSLGRFETYRIDARNILKRGLRPGERLTRLYLLPSDAPGARVEIDWIRFYGRSARYAQAPRGRSSETIAGVVRPVLYMWPEQRIAFKLRLPEEGARFEAALGVVYGNRPVRFELALRTAAGERRLLAARTVTDAEAWQPLAVDLSAFAGLAVELELAVRGARDNVALWGDPTVWGRPVRPLRIIWIVEDTLRAESLSLYGNPRKTSPFKDRLAERAVVFARAFAQATKTRPSAASYLTGLYPTATNLWHFGDVLDERYLTLAEILRAQGFATAAFIQNGNVGAYAGLHQGFGQLLDETRMGQDTERLLLGAEVWEWLARQRQRSFFLYLHLLDPHAPYDPPPAYRDERMDRGTPVAPNPTFDPPWVARPTREGRLARYEAEIRRNDALLARFFARLEEEGLAAETLVILASDHGEFMGERGLLGNPLWDHEPPSYTQVSQVPLVFVAPKRFPGGRRITTPVQLVDIVPTLLELAEVPREGLILHGRSLLPLLEGREQAWPERVVLVEEPTAMERRDPCACGSLISADWQLLGSPWAFKRSWLVVPDVITWLLTHARRLEAGASARLDLPLLADLRLRWAHRGWMGRLRDLNLATAAGISGGGGGGAVVDPATLERLRGLGYVQ